MPVHFVVFLLIVICLFLLIGSRNRRLLFFLPIVLVPLGTLWVLINFVSLSANSEQVQQLHLIDTTNNQKFPSIIYNSYTKEYLLVYVNYNHDGNVPGISAYRIDPDGNLLGSEILVSDESVYEIEPQLTVRENSAKYMIVWRRQPGNIYTTDGDIIGREVESDNVLSNLIEISSRPGRQRSPVVDYCPTTNTFLTVWDEDLDAVVSWDFLIMAQSISATTLIPAGNAITATADYPDPGHQQTSAALICNPDRDECLAVFKDARDPDKGSTGNDDIYAQRVFCNGEPMLPDDIPVTVQYSDAPGGNKQNHPVGSYNSNDDQYLILWEDQRNDEDASTPTDTIDIYGQVLLGNGRRILTPMDVNQRIITATGNQIEPDVAYSEKDNIYLIVWTDERGGGGNSNIYGQYLFSSGIPFGSEILIANAPGDQVAPAVAYNPDANNFLVVWQDNSNQTGTGNDIYGKFISSQSINPVYLPIVHGEESSWTLTDEKDRALSWLYMQTNSYSTVNDIPGYNQAGCNNQVAREDSIGSIQPPCYPAIPGDVLVSFDFCNYGTVAQQNFLGKYGRGFLYDQAVGAIALMMADEMDRAQEILDFVSSYQKEDGSFGFSFNSTGCDPQDKDSYYDNEYLRNGAIGWIGYAFVMYDRISREGRYLDVSTKAGDYLLTQQITDTSSIRYQLIKGGSGKYIDSVFIFEQQNWVATEHNIDAFFFLRDLGEITSESKYSVAAVQIRDGMLTELWDGGAGRFDRALQEDEKKDTSNTLDAASWGAIFLIAIGETEKAQRSLDFIEAHYREWTNELQGYKPNSGEVDNIHWDYEYMIWSEGSLGVAMAYIKLGGDANLQKARIILAEMAKLQDWDPDAGLMYTAYAGFEEEDYARAPSVAGTGWFVMALEALDDPAVGDKFWGLNP